MKRFALCVIFLFWFLGSSAQKNHFNLAFGYGASYFFNDPTLNRRIDNCEMIGINYLFARKNKAVQLNPGFDLQINEYHSKLPHYWLVNVNQRLLSLNLDVMMKVAKRAYLKVGLKFSQVLHSLLYVSLHDYNGQAYFSYANSELYKNYTSTNFQTGIRAGVCFPFRLFKREQKFNILFFHGASQLVNSDFYLKKAVNSEDIKILSTKARPTMLIFSFDFSLEKRKKKDPDED